MYKLRNIEVDSKLPEAKKESQSRGSSPAFTQNQPCQHLDLGPPVSELYDKKFLSLKPQFVTETLTN